MSRPNKLKTFSIVFMGASDSGCSSFLQVLCDKIWLEKEEIHHRQNNKAYQTGELEGGGPVFDLGEIHILDVVFYFFTQTRNHMHINYESMLWENFNEKTMGFVVVVDSSTPETFNLTLAIIHNISHLTSIPYVVAANKQDSDYAWSAEDIRIALRIPKEIPVIPCSTRDKKSVANVLIALCEEIIKDIKASENE